MTRQSTSLINVLSPPENPWLKDLSKRKAELPAGVRVVRFSEEDDGACEENQELAAPSRRPVPARRWDVLPGVE